MLQSILFKAFFRQRSQLSSHTDYSFFPSLFSILSFSVTIPITRQFCLFTVICFVSTIHLCLFCSFFPFLCAAFSKILIYFCLFSIARPIFSILLHSLGSGVASQEQHSVHSFIFSEPGSDPRPRTPTVPQAKGPQAKGP